MTDKIKTTANEVRPEYQPGNRLGVGTNDGQPIVADPRGSASNALADNPTAPRGERPSLRVFPGSPMEYDAKPNQAVEPSSQVTAQTPNAARPDGPTHGSRDGIVTNPSFISVEEIDETPIRFGMTRPPKREE